MCMCVCVCVYIIVTTSKPVWTNRSRISCHISTSGKEDNELCQLFFHLTAGFLDNSSVLTQVQFAYNATKMKFGLKILLHFIYSHPKTDCFIASQLFSVAKLVRCFTSRDQNPADLPIEKSFCFTIFKNLPSPLNLFSYPLKLLYTHTCTRPYIHIHYAHVWIYTYGYIYMHLYV